MNLNRWHSGVVRVQVLHPIETAELEKHNAESLRDFCQQTIRAVSSTWMRKGISYLLRNCLGLFFPFPEEVRSKSDL